ncbi:MAG: hypothetical protein D6674_08125 [Acidobacteria bacterium]|jgi:uncharacterized protein YbjQ (UPF0145 family)|nr:MAG: hypothetical protein D6674_08125 [Acidobacteriota bacterium]
MADFTKAGLDKGDIEKELEHSLISARMLYKSYLASLEDLTQEELRADLEEYKDQLNRSVMPLVRRAEALGIAKLVNMAYEIRYTYEKLINLIEGRLGIS